MTSKETMKQAIEKLEIKTQKCLNLGKKYGLNFEDPKEALNVLNF